jgi:phosphohistidine phosphatase
LCGWRPAFRARRPVTGYFQLIVMESKLLVLLRHAKSSWADPAIPDHDRPLNERGRDAAARLGRHLRRDGPWPELVLCSSSTRTRQTLELLELRPRPVVLVEDRIYGATPSDLLTRVREVPARYGTVLVIGHNPGVEDLARLIDERGLSAAGKFPTGALAVLTLAADAWDSLGPGAGQLVSFLTPRQLGSSSRPD